MDLTTTRTDLHILTTRLIVFSRLIQRFRHGGTSLLRE
nr:MAG TPA: hypothetical protein [Caudoviricetes sp.]